MSVLPAAYAYLDLGLIIINKWVNVANQSEYNELNNIMDIHKQVSKEDGCLPGEHHMEVDSKVTPTQCSNRNVALFRRKDLKEKLKSLSKNRSVQCRLPNLLNK